jgi:tetrapyrrole methylase family protein/MazG family protein
VLLQVFLHAAVAEQEGRFDVSDVAATISEKMVRRHPHVFGDVEVSDASEVASNWATIKAAEQSDRTSTFDGVPGSLPALLYARELTSRAAEQGFDWDDPRSALAKVAEELREVDEAFAGAPGSDSLAAEIGDLLLAVVDVARRSKVDPEVALRRSATTFRARVTELERLAAERGVDVPTAGEQALLALWAEAKTAVG